MTLGRDEVLIGEKLDVPCPCPVKCLWEPFPPLLNLFCFLQMCSMDKDPHITCKLLCYICSLMLYTCLSLPSWACFCFCFFLQRSESWHNLCWHFSAIDLLSSAFLSPWVLMPHSPHLMHQDLDSFRSYPDLSFFSKLKCGCEGLNSWSLMASPEKINWDAVLYFAVTSLGGTELNSWLARWLPSCCSVF